MIMMCLMVGAAIIANNICLIATIRAYYGNRIDELSGELMYLHEKVNDMSKNDDE